MKKGDVSFFQIVNEFVLGGFSNGLGSVEADDLNEHFEVESFLNVLLVFYDFIIGELAVLDFLGVAKSREKVKNLFGREERVIL